jgi:hypothetical protein
VAHLHGVNKQCTGVDKQLNMYEIIYSVYEGPYPNNGGFVRNFTHNTSDTHVASRT